MIKPNEPETAIVKNKGGRPTKYRRHMIEQVENMAMLGLTQVQMAGMLGIGLKTLERWMKAYPRFRRAVKRGKAEYDGKVARSLFERATGYNHPDTKFMVVSQGKNVPAEIQAVEYTKHVPPDITAMIFWLKNRQPELWRDVHQVDHGLANSLTDVAARFAALKNGNGRKVIESEVSDS
jgi:hypothetical protein